MSPSKLLSTLSAAGLLVAVVAISPSARAAGSAPTLTPADQTYVVGEVPIEAFPTARGDQVVELKFDDQMLRADTSPGTSMLRFGVGGNSIEGRYGSYFLINGKEDQRINLDKPEYVNEIVEVEVPNEWLVKGDNVVSLKVGAIETSCGLNLDDFEMYDVELETGGPVQPSDDNQASYNMGDGSCGSNTTLLKDFDAHFRVDDDPQAQTGLTAKFDSVQATDGEHVITATTAQGGVTRHTVHVNNGDARAPQLNVRDGQVLQGEVLIHDVVTGDAKSAARYEIDGKPLVGEPSGGTGEAAFGFTIGKNSSEARYGNTVLVNNQPIPLTDRDYVSEAVRVEFPAAYLQPGRNEIVMQTGSVPSSCGTNHDDFHMSRIGLEVSGGTATGVDLKNGYDMGDGNCGSSPKKLLKATFAFDVMVNEPGVRVKLDTTQYADGKHQIAVVTADGRRLVRNVIIDNSGPSLTSSTPADGAHLTEATKLDVGLEDVSGVDEKSLRVTLDGAAVSHGDLIGAGLAAGEHSLVVVAKDTLGHESTHTITFTSAAIPGGPVKTTQAETSDNVYDLSATVDNGGDQEYVTSFHLGRAGKVTAGSEGESLEIPKELNPVGKGELKLADVVATDDRADRSPAAKNTSWQRFDVEVGDDHAGALVHWQGDVDPQRLAHMLVWDHKQGEWTQLAQQRGVLNAATVLTGNARAEHVKDGVVNVMVAATDPFADDIHKKITGEFQDPQDYDFAIAHLTDTQYLSEGAAGDWRTDNKDLHPDAERALWRAAYADTLRWVVDNADQRKIQYMAHTGDIIENNTKAHAEPEMRAQVQREWEEASKIQKIIDDSGIPNGVLPGNHDNRYGTDETMYNEHFGPGRYEQVSKSWRPDASYGGPWKPGDNENHYDLFSAGGLDFVAVHLGYGVTREEIAWANSIFRQYPDRNGLLFSHAYLTTSTEPDGRDAPYSNAQGREQARRIVEQNPNVVMIMSGHHHGVGLNVRKDAGEVGNHVVEMLADYQFYEVPTSHPKLAELRANYPEGTTLRFGSAFFRLLQFDVDRGELVINAYSPFFNEFGAEEYDLEKRYEAESDEFRVPLQLSSRSTSFSTDAVGVIVPTDEVLGTAKAKAGEAATVTVDFAKVAGLPQIDGLSVAWVAVAKNASGGVIVSPFNLLTLDLAPAGADPSDPDEPGEDGSAEPGDPDEQPRAPEDADSEEPETPGLRPRPRPGLPSTGVGELQVVLTA